MYKFDSHKFINFLENIKTKKYPYTNETSICYVNLLQSYEMQQLNYETSGNPFTFESVSVQYTAVRKSTSICLFNVQP